MLPLNDKYPYGAAHTHWYIDVLDSSKSWGGNDSLNMTVETFARPNPLTRVTTPLTDGQRSCANARSEWTQHCVEMCALETCCNFVLETKLIIARIL